MIGNWPGLWTLFAKEVKRFTVVMNGSWNGDEGVLDEDFFYSDGTRQKRIWRLKRLPDGAVLLSEGRPVAKFQAQPHPKLYSRPAPKPLPI